MTRRPRIRLLPALLGVLAVVSSVPAAVAQRVAPHRHVLRAADYDAGTFVPPIRAAAGKTLAPTVDINVTYSGFSTQARQAFEYAVSLWEAHLMSPVTVQVEATFEPLEEDVLGSAGPRLTANFSASAFDDTWYPTAIADALVGQNVDTGSADIIASFNSEFDSWYFGTDGQTPTGQYDFVSVVLHELGHGLGFTGFFAWHAVVMTWQSWLFNDTSQGVVVVPLWIPQLGYAGGLVILALAMLDELVHVGRGEAPRYEKPPAATAEEVVERAIQSGV